MNEPIKDGLIERHNEHVEKVAENIFDGYLKGAKPLVKRDVGRRIVEKAEAEAKNKGINLP